MPRDDQAGWITTSGEAELERVKDRYFSVSGITLDEKQPGPAAAFAIVLAGLLKALDDSGGDTYFSNWAQSATGRALVLRCSPLIGDPFAATSSNVVLPLLGNALLQPGELVRLESDGPNGSTWLFVGDAANPGQPLQLPGDGQFVHTGSGPKEAIAGSAWVRASAALGWDGVGVNAEDAELGTLAETEAQYRLRYSQALAGQRLLAAVLDVEGVTGADIFENFGVKDAIYGRTHWTEIMVEGGDDMEIALAMYGARTHGVSLVGSVSVVVPSPGHTSGELSGEFEIRFSRPELVDAWIDLTIVRGEGFSPDITPDAIAARGAEVISHTVAEANMRPRGLDMTAGRIEAFALLTPTVENIGEVNALLGFAAPPLESILPATNRQRLNFDSSRATYSEVAA